MSQVHAVYETTSNGLSGKTETWHRTRLNKVA